MLQKRNMKVYRLRYLFRDNLNARYTWYSRTLGVFDLLNFVPIHVQFDWCSHSITMERAKLLDTKHPKSTKLSTPLDFVIIVSKEKFDKLPLLMAFRFRAIIFIFSHASTKAECDLSSLSCVFLHDPPQWKWHIH